MAKVAKTMKNLQKCLCPTCPSYRFEGKKRKMPGNMIVMMGDGKENLVAEALYCAFGKSQAITEQKGCMCGDCAVFKQYDPGNGYFCLGL